MATAMAGSPGVSTFLDAARRSRTRSSEMAAPDKLASDAPSARRELCASNIPPSCAVRKAALTDSVTTPCAMAAIPAINQAFGRTPTNTAARRSTFRDRST